MSLTVKKILREFGLIGLVRLPFVLLGILVHNVRLNLFRKDEKVLLGDIKKIKTLSIKDFSFIPFQKDESFKEGNLKWFYQNKDKNRFWNNIENAAIVSSVETTFEDELKVREMIPQDKDEAYYRFHDLNKGGNDQWEWFLTPWHRSIHWFSYLLWDKRYTNHLMPVYEFYKKWYREDFIWFTFVGTGSNIFACEAGKAYHCLNEYLLEGNTKMLERYIKHVNRVRYFIEHHFDNGVPMEGGIYARFLLMTVVHLDWIHRQLGLEYRFFSNEFIEKYANYLNNSFTKDDGFETSGDSHFEKTFMIENRVIHYFSQISEYPIFKEILKYYNPNKNHTIYLNK